MKLYASSFVLGDLTHPNKMPFSGVLTWLNAVSDRAPIGSKGLPVYISAEVGIPALPSLVGMAVNYMPDTMSGHNVQLKIGVIETASVGESDETGAIPVNISGYIFAQDFEAAAIAIKLNQASLGFSYETSARTLISSSVVSGREVYNVDEIEAFTGASILWRDKASYQNTSLAASVDPTLNGGETLDTTEILAAIVALREYVDAQFTLLREQAWRDSAVESAQEYVDEAADAVNEAAETLDEIIVEAVVDEVINTDSVEGLKTQLSAANAKIAELAATAPARKSVSAITALMAKFDSNGSPDYSQIMASIDSRTDLSVEDRLALKLEARRVAN